ncbi:MAG: SusC/RagA family TonB-linked outer membrane protein [Cyclobacteriaceae bacterium]
MKKTILNVVITMSKKLLQALFVNCLLLSTIYASNSNAQYVRSVRSEKIDIELNKTTLVRAFNKIESMTNYNFAYQDEDISKKLRISGKFQKKSVADVLTEISKQSKLKFRQVNNTIHISKNEEFPNNSVEVVLMDVDISGKITDENSEGLPGASIVVKGSAKGTTTDLDGNYKLSVPEGSTIVISFVGYKTSEIEVGNQTVIDLKMAPDAEQLEEVVVTALGVERETKSLTYARQGVDTEDMKEARSSNFVQSLSGRVAGVSVTNSQTPSGSNRVVIRGVNSLTGNNQPLYVVDGIPLDNTTGDDEVSVWNGGTDIDYGDPLSQINPDDIESVEVLKGANGSALYGSRAANGVILITTKKGKSAKGEWGITINSNIMFNQVNEYPDYQYVYGGGNGHRVANGTNNFDVETGLPTPGGETRAYGAPMFGFDVLSYNGEVIPYLPRTEGIKELYKTGSNLSNSVTLQKSSANGTFRLTYTNTNASWVMLNMEDQSKHNISLRSTTKLTEDLSVDASVLYTNDQVRNRVYQNGSERNPANNYMYIRPDMFSGNLFPYKDENGNAFSYRGPFNNPWWGVYENNNQDENNRIISSVALSYNILEGLKFRGKAMTDVRLQSGSEFNDIGAAYDIDGMYRAFNQDVYNWNFEGMFTYNKTWEKLSLNTILGGNIYKYRLSRRQTTIASLLLRDVESLSNSASIPSVLERDREKTIESVFASASIGYNGIVFLDLTARNDRSSTLPSNNNSYFYPSVGSSFVFTEIMPQNNVLSFGKLRASWAQVGNDASPYQTSTVYNYSGNYNGISTVVLDQTRKNVNLKPEQTNSIELGLETMFLANRISLNATYYKSSTTNQIVEAEVSPTTGFNRQVYNAGEIQNKGFEIYLGAKILENNFKWNVDINWSKNESLVVSLLDGVDRFRMRSWFNAIVYAEVGQPFGTIRGWVGQRDEEGHYLVGNNGRILRNEDQILGNAQPDWIGGIRNTFSYKNFSFNFLVDIKSGGEMYSGTYLKNTNHGQNIATLYGRDDYYFSSIILGENNDERRGVGLYGHDYIDSDRPKGAIYEDSYIGVRDPETGEWVAGEPNTNYINTQQYFYDIISSQERATFNTSYVKLREVVLGYTFDRKLLEKTPFNSAKVSFVARNLWTIHRNTPRGLDPEAGTTSGNGQGIEYGSFLPMRSLGFNVNFSF